MVYYTDTLSMASMIVTNPWFVLIAVGVIGFFMLLMTFAIVPAIFTRNAFGKPGGK